MKVVLPEAILSYPALGKPKLNNLSPEQAPRYGCDIIFPKGTDLTALQAVLQQHVADDFNGVAPKNLCLKSTTTKIDRETGLPLPIYGEGDFYMSPWASEAHPPQLFSPGKVGLEDPKAGYAPQNFKGGNKVIVQINTWAAKGFGGTIGAGLQAVQWVGDGSPVSPSVSCNDFQAQVAPVAAPMTPVNPLDAMGA